MPHPDFLSDTGSDSSHALRSAGERSGSSPGFSFSFWTQASAIQAFRLCSPRLVSMAAAISSGRWRLTLAFGGSVVYFRLALVRPLMFGQD